MEIFILYSYIHVWNSDTYGTALVLESFSLLDRFSTSGDAWQYIWWVIFIVNNLEYSFHRNFWLKQVLVYYMAELSFYFSLACTLLIDNKRKDFNEQIIHHVATLALLGLSYVCNFTRIGALVMWCHDISDIFLESAKLCVYAKPTIAKVPVADILFAIFGIIFFVW